MSLRSLYSGFKFLNDNLIKPTKSLFEAQDQKQSQFTDRTKANSSSESISQVFSKTEDEDERDIWEEGLDCLNEVKSSQVKRSEATRSSTTFFNHAQSAKSRHGHTKSLLTMVGNEGVDLFSLHEGSLEVVQSNEAPILFARGGYDQHISIPKNSKLHSSKKSISQSKHKGGFVIIEDSMEDPLSNYNVKIPQLPIQNLSRLSSDQYYDTKEETFLANRLEFNKSNKPLKSQPAAFKNNDNYDPLDSARSTSTNKSNKLRGDHRRFCSTIPSTKDSLFSDTRPVLTKAKTNISPFSVNTPISTAMTWERAASSGKNGTSSNSENSLNGSKHGSIIILEDATSELDFGLECEETDRNSTIENRFYEVESQSSLVRTKLIDELKAMKGQQLCLKGIYVIPSEDPLIWNCLVFVKGGYYENGKFKFQIQIPKEYPADNIKVYSLTKVYHPLINIETGEVDLKLCEQTGENRIEQVLLFIKSIFNESKYLEKVNSFNHEAGSKFSDNPYYFKIKAKESVKRTEKNSLNEKENILPIVNGRIDLVRSLVKNAASSSNKFDVKVQNLIQDITRNIVQTN